MRQINDTPTHADAIPITLNNHDRIVKVCRELGTRPLQIVEDDF